MEQYNVILFLLLSFWIFKYKAAQETTENQSSNDARVIGLLIGFFTLLGFIAIFVALWCYCCHYDRDKSKEKLPVRNVSVKPMVLPEHTRPPLPTISKPQAEREHSSAKAREDLKANEIVPPEKNKVDVDDMPKDNSVEDDGTQLDTYRQ